MTAVSLFTLSGGAHLLTDTAEYHADGRVLGFGSKVSACPRLRIAVACNGTATNTTTADLTAELDRHETQALSLSALPAFVAALDAEMSDLIAIGSASGHTEPLVQLFVAAWDSAAHRPAAFIIGSRAGTFGPGYEPLTLRRVSRVVSPPVAAALYPDTPGFALPAGALTLIEAQRRTPNELGVYLVGGAADLTTVDASGARTRTLRTWPDQIGSKING